MKKSNNSIIRIAKYRTLCNTHCNIYKQISIDNRIEIVEEQSLPKIVSMSRDFDYLLTSFCLKDMQQFCKTSCLLFFPIMQTTSDRNINYEKVLIVRCAEKIDINKVLFSINKEEDIVLSILGISYSSLLNNIKKAILLLKEDLFISAKKISKALNISRVHLSNLFKKQLSVSFSEFKLLLRVTTAINQFMYDKKDLKKIAYDLQYSSTSHLYRDLHSASILYQTLNSPESIKLMDQINKLV